MLLDFFSLSLSRRIRAAGGRLLQTASCWLLGKTRALFRGHQVHGQFMKHLCFGNKSEEKKVKSGMGSPDWNVSMVNIHLWKLLWVYHLDMEWRGMTWQIDWQVKPPSHVACFSEYLKCWGAWDTTCGHKVEGITPMIAWRREMWKRKR